MSTTLASHVNETREVPVTASTIRRQLTEQGIRSRKPVHGPVLSRRYRQLRLQFACSHSAWTVADWKQVLCPDLHCRVQMDVNECGEEMGLHTNSLNLFAGRISSDAQKWYGAASNTMRKRELYICCRPSMTAAIYIKDIILNYVVPFAPFIGDGFLLQQDNGELGIQVRIE